MKADHDAARHVATKTLRARPIKIGPRAAWEQGCGLFPIPGIDACVASRREWRGGDGPHTGRAMQQRFTPTKQNDSTMAKVLAHRPRYRARMSVIYYLHGDQLLLRKRPAQIHDPRTPAQRRQRLRMRVASHFLAGFRDIVSLGFSPELQDNFRQVGAYQRALGHLMRNALTAHGEGVTLAPERVLLAQGADNPMGRLSLHARGRMLRIGWDGRVPPRCRTLLVGIWNRGAGRALSRQVCHNPGDRAITIAIPEGWAGDTLDVWVAPWAEGEKGRYTSTHAALEGEKGPQPLPGGRLADLPAKALRRRIAIGGWRRVRAIDVYCGRRKRE